MDRRSFVKQVSASAVLGAVAPQVLADNSRSYDSETISLRLVEERPGVTTVFLIELGDADYTVVEAFYWTTFPQGNKIMLSKETACPVSKGVPWATELRMPLDSIVFLRVREMNFLKQTDFGNVPK